MEVAGERHDARGGYDPVADFVDEEPADDDDDAVLLSNSAWVPLLR